MYGHAVAAAAVEEAGAGELPDVRRGVGELVVGDDEDEREVFDGGEVGRFVQGSGGGGAVSHAGDADGSGHFAVQPFGDESSRDDGDAAAEVADGDDVAFFGLAAVDVAVAAAHVAESGAEVGARAFDDGFAPGDASGLFADEGEVDVFAGVRKTPSEAAMASWPLPRKTPPMIFPAL